jgi:hypothetical protein
MASRLNPGQHVVRQLPVRLVVVRREQPVPDHRPQVGDAEPDMLGEAGLVRHVRRQVGAPHEHELPVERPAPEDRPQLPGEPQGVLQRRTPVGAQHIAEQRQPVRRMGYAEQLRPALLGAAESLRQPGPCHRLRHDAISLAPAAG